MPQNLLGPGKLRFPRRSRTARVVAVLTICAFIAAAYAWIHTRVTARPFHLPLGPGVAVSAANDMIQLRSVIQWHSTNETDLGYSVINTKSPPPSGITWWESVATPAAPVLWNHTSGTRAQLFTKRPDGTTLEATWIESSIIILPMRNLLIALLLIAIALIGFPRRFARLGHCTHCDYNLTGNESGRCPECGAPIATATPDN